MLAAIQATGLTENGDGVSHFYGVPRLPGEIAADKLNKEIDKATVMLRQPQNCKNKIMARIWMADTMGEACVIMNEVLGTVFFQR